MKGQCVSCWGQGEELRWKGADLSGGAGLLALK